LDRIIDHLKLTFVAERPRASQAAFQELLMDADFQAEFHAWSVMSERRSVSISSPRPPLMSLCWPAPALTVLDASQTLFNAPSQWLDGTTEAMTRPW